MAKQTQRHSYEVHLTADIVEELGIDSPISTDRIDYYDSGLWVTHQEGRDFYPYDHVLTIHERSSVQETAGTAASAQGESPVDVSEAEAEED
jgi:hypothetical protein